MQGPSFANGAFGLSVPISPLRSCVSVWAAGYTPLNLPKHTAAFGDYSLAADQDEV